MKMTIEAFNVLCGQIAHRGKLQVKDIQRAAVAAIYFSIADRNSTPANTLFTAVRDAKGLNERALGRFFEAYGDLAVTDKGEKISFFDREEMLAAEPVEWTEALERELMDTPWHEMASAKAVSEYMDVQEMLQKLVKRASNAVKNQTKEVRHADMILEINALLGKYAQQEVAA